jgi:hypothetical protein
MQYMLLIYTDESGGSTVSEEQLRQMYAQYGTFSQALRDAGKLGANEELDAPATARSLRLEDGRPVVTDGPYAETREQLGGFYLVEAADMDEALEWAAQVPSAAHGTIEVRPIKDNSAYYTGPQ